MISAYQHSDLKNLDLFEAARTLQNDGFIDKNQGLEELEKESVLYHPGWLMRILLFIVGLIAIQGILGLWFLAVGESFDESWKFMLVLTGSLGLVAHEFLLVRQLKHYKSGLTEVSLYNFTTLLSAGIIGFLDYYESLAALSVALVCAILSIRFLDMLLAAASLVSLEIALFLFMFDFGGLVQNLIPFTSLVAFAAIYFVNRRLEKQERFNLWSKQTQVVEAISLLMVYISGNYLVVRELSVELLDMALDPGEDIAFAWMFVMLSIALPILFIFNGLKSRNRIQIWVGLLSAGFSVFTLHFYKLADYPEITLSISGLLVLCIAVFVLNALKKPKNGFTRNRLTRTHLDFLTAEGIIISQTAGGLSAGSGELFKGGEFGGGGASGNF